MLTLLANTAFWLLLADAFLMAASRKEEGRDHPIQEERGGAFSRLRSRLAGRHEQRTRESFVSFIEAYQMSLATLGSVHLFVTSTLSLTSHSPSLSPIPPPHTHPLSPTPPPHTHPLSPTPPPHTHLLLSFSPSPGEVIPYEALCLKIAEGLLWLEYLKLALFHWSSEQPFLVSELMPLILIPTCFYKS